MEVTIWFLYSMGLLSIVCVCVCVCDVQIYALVLSHESHFSNTHTKRHPYFLVRGLFKHTHLVQSSHKK